MSVCYYCKKEIVKDDEFILLGKYPSTIKIRLRSASSNVMPPENFGKIYHKSCFFESLRAEGRTRVQREESERKKALIRREGQPPSVPSRERSYV